MSKRKTASKRKAKSKKKVADRPIMSICFANKGEKDQDIIYAVVRRFDVAYDYKVVTSYEKYIKGKDVKRIFSQLKVKDFRDTLPTVVFSKENEDFNAIMLAFWLKRFFSKDDNAIKMFFICRPLDGYYQLLNPFCDGIEISFLIEQYRASHPELFTFLQK